VAAVNVGCGFINEGPNKVACTDIVKKGVRQMRYSLKRKYFDESLTMEQLIAKGPPPKMKKEEWIQLVEYCVIQRIKSLPYIIAFVNMQSNYACE
jgi:hypothetical protein